MQLRPVFNGVKLIVEGRYEEEEPTVMYCSDGSGEPGSKATFEIESVHSLHGDDITELFDFDYFDALGKKMNLLSKLEESCLEQFETDFPEEFERDDE